VKNIVKNKIISSLNFVNQKIEQLVQLADDIYHLNYLNIQILQQKSTLLGINWAKFFQKLNWKYEKS